MDIIGRKALKLKKVGRILNTSVDDCYLILDDSHLVQGVVEPKNSIQKKMCVEPILIMNSLLKAQFAQMKQLKILIN